MSRIHYFQRYSSPENTVTNNTLQLFGRIYEYSPRAASRLLSELTGQAVDIGVEITQQNRQAASIPDGTIVQRSFKIAIETKVDAALDFDQLARHAASFAAEETRVLLLLTKTPLTEIERGRLSVVQAEWPGVVVRNITFEQVCMAVMELFKPHEESIAEIAGDYVEYCNDSGLFDQSRELMRIVPCGRSIKLNQVYGIYFQPSDRSYTNHAYVGIYNQKKVHSVLQIKSVFDIELDGDNLLKTCVQGENTDAYDESIRKIIADAHAECGYSIETGHRFFCGDLAHTSFNKITAGGIRGAQFINLREHIRVLGSLDDIAARLREAVWY